MIPGKRKDCPPDATDNEYIINLRPGEYGKSLDGTWYAVCPVDTGDWFTNFLANLGDGAKTHQITEHADGTITVSPSILVKRHDGEWHGFLRKGVWSLE